MPRLTPVPDLCVAPDGTITLSLRSMRALGLAPPCEPKASGSTDVPDPELLQRPKRRMPLRTDAGWTPLEDLDNDVHMSFAWDDLENMPSLDGKTLAHVRASLLHALDPIPPDGVIVIDEDEDTPSFTAETPPRSPPAPGKGGQPRPTSAPAIPSPAGPPIPLSPPRLVSSPSTPTARPPSPTRTERPTYDDLMTLYQAERHRNEALQQQLAALDARLRSIESPSTPVLPTTSAPTTPTPGSSSRSVGATAKPMPLKPPREVPKYKSKPLLAPKTSATPRRTTFIPAFTKLRRAELELLAEKWSVATAGLTMAQIQDELFAIDARLTAAHLAKPGA